MKLLSAGVFGVLFGIGLLISGMLDPAKVLGFLDVAGAWNPQLAFVMIGAIAAAAPAFFVARRRTRTLLGDDLHLPARGKIDRRLIGGAVIFGIGWGLAGICPGPAIVLLGFLGWRPLVFTAAMVIGMFLAGNAGRVRLPGAPRGLEAAEDGAS